jgi:hypothetical protein
MEKPKYTLGKQSREHLNGCRGVLLLLVERALARSDMPYDFKITEGHRPNAEQDALYAIGRRGIPGERTVTNARAGQSLHNVWPSQAFDLMVLVKGREWEAALYDAIAPVMFDEWRRMAAESLTTEILPDGKSITWDLEWGGNWRSKDRPHWQITKRT